MNTSSLNDGSKKPKKPLPIGLFVAISAIVLALALDLHILWTAQTSKSLSANAIAYVNQLNERLFAQGEEISQLRERINDLEKSNALGGYSTEHLFYLSQSNSGYGYIKIEDQEKIKYPIWTFVDEQYNEARETEWLTIFGREVAANEELKDALLRYTHEDKDIYAGHIETDSDGYFTEAGLNDFLSRIRLNLNGEIYLYDGSEPLFTRIHLRTNYSSLPNYEGLFVFFPISSC